MTAAAIGYLQRQYATVLRRCALANGLGWMLLAGLPPAMAQSLNVVPDNRTATHVSQQGGVATVTTGTTRGVNAFNSFSRFDVGAGQQVNLMLPDGTSNLINTVGGGRSQIDGWVNAYKAGRIGGNVFFFNPEGFVVGATGVLNAGSLTLAAPTPAFVNQLIDPLGRIGDGAVLQALTGTYPLSATGLVRVQGRINAADAVTLTAGQVSTDAGSRIAAGPAGAAAFAALVNVDGLDSAAGVSTSGGRIRILGTGDVTLGGVLRGAPSADGGATVSVTAGGNATLAAGAQVLSAGAPVAVAAGTTVTVDGALISSRDIGAAADDQHETAPSQGASGTVDLSATRVAVTGGARLLAHGDNGRAGGAVRLTAQDDASRATFGSTEDQSARITVDNALLKGSDVVLRATADDKYIFTASQAAQNPTMFQDLGNTLVDFATSLRLFADATVSKAEASINVGGGSVLQATTGDVDLRATSRAEARMNVRSTIIGFGYGEATSRASVDVGQASLRAGRDVLLKSQADNTINVEVGTTNIGNANNNASNPTGYANAAVAIGVAEQTATVRTGAASQVSAGRTLSLEATGAKSFDVASSGGSFQDGIASAGVSVGLSKTKLDAQLGGSAQAGSVQVGALLDDATSTVQAAAGTAGKPQNVQEAITSARTLDGSFIEGLTGLIAKIPSTDGRSGNKEKFGLSASVAFADVDNHVSASIAPAAQVTSRGATAITAQATDTPTFRASAAVDERDTDNAPAGDDAANPKNKSVAISGAVVVADMDHATQATIGDGATVNSAGALDVAAHSTLEAGWAPHAALIHQLREMDWKSVAAYSDLGLKLKDLMQNPSQGNTWTQNSVESEKLSLTAAVTYFTLDNQATARIGAANINAGTAPIDAARDVRVSALAEQGMLHLTGVPELDGTLLSSNAGSGKAGVGGSYLQFVMGGGSDASIASGASVRADDLAVSARTDFDQIMVTETAGKAGKLSINGSFSLLQSDLNTVAQIGAGTTIDAGNVLLLAHDDSLVVNIAGGVARAGSIGVGFSVALNEMDRHTQALVGNRDGETATGGTLNAEGNLLLDARSAGTQGAFALAGSGPSGGDDKDAKGGDGSKTAAGDTGQQGKSGIGISAAASVNIAGDHTTARVRDLAGVNARGTALGAIAYASDDGGDTWNVSALAPGARAQAANPTLTLAGAGGLSIASGKTAGLAGAFAWNELEKDTQAGFAHTSVTAAAGIGASSLNSNAMWSVSAGANAGGKFGVAGSVSYSTIDNQSLAQAVDAQLHTDGSVRLDAGDTSSIRSIAGAASYGGKAGFGAALGLAEVDNVTAAEVVRGTVDAAGLNASATSGNEILSVAAALAVSQGIAGSGAVTINRIGNETRAGAQQAAVQGGAGTVAFTARDESDMLSVAGSVALTTGSVGVGLAAAYNEIGNTTTAGVTGGTVEGGQIALSALQGANVQAISAGGSGSDNVGITGSLGINRIDNTTTAKSSDATLVATGSIGLDARDAAELHSITGAASAAGNAAVGASASYNDIGGEVAARVTGGSLDAADIAVTARRGATFDVWAIAGTAGGTAGIAGSIAMNLAGGSTLARVDGGARVSASNNALVLADADDFIKARAGAAAVGGTVGAGGAIAFNDVDAVTAAEVGGAGTLLEGLAQGAAGVAVPDGTLSARTATQRPSQNPLSSREQTETLHGAGVVAASTAGVENFAVTLSGGGTAGVAGTVTVSMLGGETRAVVDDQARVNRVNPVDAAGDAQQGLVAAYHHDQLFSGTGGGAIGGTVGAGGAADTALVTHATRAKLDHGALAGRAAARVASGSTSEITQGIVGLGGGTVGLAGSIGVILSQGRTETLVTDSEVDSARGDIDITAGSRATTDIAAGALAAGAVGVGITATVTLANQQTSVLTQRSRLDAPGTTTVQADSDFTQHVYGATATVTGGLGVAGTVDVLVMKGSTSAEVGDGSAVNTRAHAATQDVVVRADDTARIDNKVGGLGVGVGVGASAAVDVTLLRSGASAGIDTGADVRAGRDIQVEANATRDIDSLSIAGGAGLTTGIAGAVSVVSVGVRPDSDSDDNASRSVAKASELTRGKSTGDKLGSSGGAAAQAARAKADSARGAVDLSSDLAATPTRQSAQAEVQSGASLRADRDVNVLAHTRNDIDAKAVGVAVSAGFSLGGGFAVALSQERTRAALVGSTRAGRDVTVQALDDQTDTSTQQAYAGGGGAVGLAASYALNRKSSNAVAELGGSVDAGGGVTVESIVDHDLQAKGLGGALGVLGIGAAIGQAQDTSLSDARVADGTVVTSGSLAVRGRAGSQADTDVTAAAGGLFAGGAGADAETSNAMRASTTVGDDVTLRLGHGSAEFSASATPRGVATARGVAISAGYSMGVSVSDVDIASNASVTVGDRLKAAAGSLTLTAETSRQRIGTLPQDLPIYAPNAQAESIAAAGGLLIGASATEASATVRPGTQVHMGTGHELALDDGFSARALSSVDARSDVTGLNIGLVAAGGNLSTTRVDSDTQALVGAGRIAAQTVTVRGDSTDALGAESTSGAGGLGVVLAARVKNLATANTASQLAGTIDADNVDIDATHTTRLHGEADSTSASVAGYSGAGVLNTASNTTTAELAAGSAVNATSFTLNALSAVAKDAANADWAVRAASGGAISGSAGGTLTQIDNVTAARVGDGARITTTDRGDQQAVLDIGAHNRLDVFDSVLLDTGGAIAVAKTESFVDARRDDAQVRIGTGALLKSRRDVHIEAETSGVVDTEAQSKTYGLAGAAEGETRSRIVTANGITLDGGRIESDQDVQLVAGANNVLRADAETRLWNRTAVPIPSAPDALAMVVQDNRIVINPYTPPADTVMSSDLREAQMQRAAIATVGDIELLAGGGQRDLRGFGRGTDLYREALQALGRVFDSDLSLDTQAGTEIDLPGSTVRVDGTLFAGTRWRQYLDIGANGQVLRQSDGVHFTTRDNVDIGREIDTRINALKLLVQTYADNPAVAAGFQSDLDLLQSRRAQLGIGAKVGFIDLDPATAVSGNIRITGNALVGGAGGELVAPGDTSIRVTNASDRFLSVKNLPGSADCPAALCIPGDVGGEVTFNGARVASNADVNLRNAPGQTATLGRIDEKSNSPAPLIELRNTGDGATPRPEVQVYGDILNPRGTVRIASTGSVTVSSDVSAQTVDIATQGDFIKTFSLGYTHTAGDPTLVIKSLTDAEEAASRRAYPTADNPLLALVTPRTASDTVASVSKPTGTIVAGNNVFISGEKLNLNGVIQSGIADVRVAIDNGTLADAKNANGAWIALKNNAFSNLDATLRPKLRWNAATGELELGNIQVEGGYMQLFGDILSTGGGQLNVLDGYGRIQIDNTTGAPLVLNRLDTGSGVQGKIRITDTSTRDAQGNNLVTTITRSGGQVVTTQENVATKDNARPVVTAITSDASGRTAQYTPRADRRLNWINAENTAVDYSLIYTRTCAVSCDFGSLADWLAKNAPTQTVVVSPPPVYTPRISGYWLSERDPRSADYIYSFRKERYDQGGTNEYFTGRYRSGAANFYDNIVTRRDWSWKERNFYTHSLAASRPVAIHFIGDDVGTLRVTSTNAPIKLGDTVRNLKGTTTLDASAIGLAHDTSLGATAGQVIADNLVLTARGGGIGDFSGSQARPLEVALTDTGRVDLRAGADIALRSYQGGLRLGRVELPGRLDIEAEGDIARAAGVSSPVAAGDIRLVSDNGGIGSLAAPLLINLPAGRGGLEARAAHDIGIAEDSGDLRVKQVASSGGDVLLRAGNGSIIDVDTVSSVKQETRDALLAVGRRAGLTADSGALAGVQATVSRYEAGKRQEYLAYWQLRGLKERFDAHGVSLGYQAAAYNPNYVFTVDAATAAQLKQANGWTDAQLAAWRDSQTAFYHRAAAEFGTGDARTYDPAWRFDASAHPELLASLSNGGVWTEAQITQRVAAGLFKDTADTQILVENPNVSGRRIQLDAAHGGIGRASAAIDISRDPTKWTEEQQLALLAADRADVQVTPTSVRITPKDDLNIAMAPTGALTATARDSVYLGAEGDLRLDRVSSANGDVRIKARGNLVQLAPGTTAVSGHDVLVEAGGGALGAGDSPLKVVTRGGGAVTARSASDLALAGDGALVIDQVFTPSAAWLSTDGAITGRLDTADLNVRAGALTLSAGTTIGLPGDPLAALDISVTGPLALSANGGAWLSATGSSLELASAHVANGPLRIAAAVPKMTVGGPVTASGSVDLDVAGDLQLDAASSVDAGALTLAAGGGLRGLGSLTVAGATSITSGGALLLAGHQALQGDTRLTAGSTLELRGDTTIGGTLQAKSAGGFRQQGSLSLAGDASFDVGGAALFGGTVFALGDLSATGGSTLAIDGVLQVAGDATLAAASDWTLRGVLLAGTLDARAGRDLVLGGLARTKGDALFTAGRDLRSTGIVRAGGSLRATAERDLVVIGPMPTAAQGVVLQAKRRKVLPGGAR